MITTGGGFGKASKFTNIILGVTSIINILSIPSNLYLKMRSELFKVPKEIGIGSNSHEVMLLKFQRVLSYLIKLKKMFLLHFIYK